MNRPSLGDVGGTIVGVVFVVAGVLKAWTPASMEPVLASIGMPRAAMPNVIGGVIFLEVLTGVGLVQGGAHRRWHAAGLAMLSVWSLVLAWLLTRADPPRCGCLGDVLLPVSARTEAALSLGKNFILAALLAWGWRPRTAGWPGAYNSGRWVEAAERTG